jgi:phosphoribosyl-ATP pyrophosphohydrolase
MMGLSSTGCASPVRVRVLFAALLFFSLSTAALSARAQERCPWINAATAAGAMDASVTVTVTHPNGKPTDGLCEFTHKQGSDSRQLRVQVEVMAEPAQSFSSYLARCGADATPLTAIGNEAVVCTVAAKNAQAEQVIGRVRDQAFVILLRSNDKSLAESTLRDRARRVAEIVAGNLF